MAKQLGVGVISLGWMGRLHSRAYRSLAERYPELDVELRLVAAADPEQSARDAATGALGFEKAYADYRDLLADPDIDVVSICSPNFLHHEIALAAAAAGKPFWIEKPMGVTADQSREIAQAAQQAGLVTSVGFNYRQAPAIQKLRQLVKEGDLGRITNVRVWLIADYASSPKGPLTWRYEIARAGHGVVGDLMSHGVDLAQYVVGRIASVTALTGTFIGERPFALSQGVGHAAVEVSEETGPVENEDYVGLLARFDSGVVGTLESSRVAVGPRSSYRLEVYGTQGSARWDFEDMNYLDVCIDDGGPLHGYTHVAAGGPGFGDYARFQPGPGISMSYDDLKVVEGKLFVESVLTGSQLAPSAADAWSAAAVDEAIVASAADGQWHDVERTEGALTFDR